MLGEAGTTEIARNKNAQGFIDNRTAAKQGGTVAGNARKELEAKTGTPVISQQNYLNPAEALPTPKTSIKQLEGSKKKLVDKGRGKKK